MAGGLLRGNIDAPYGYGEAIDYPAAYCVGGAHPVITARNLYGGDSGLPDEYIFVGRDSKGTAPTAAASSFVEIPFGSVQRTGTIRLQTKSLEAQATILNQALMGLNAPSLAGLDLIGCNLTDGAVSNKNFFDDFVFRVPPAPEPAGCLEADRSTLVSTASHHCGHKPRHR